MSDLKEELGRRVKQRRTDMNMTMDELADKTGYTSPSKKTIIYQIEAGKNEMKLSRLLSFSSVLDTNVYYLLGLADICDITDEDIIQLIREKYSNSEG